MADFSSRRRTGKAFFQILTRFAATQLAGAKNRERSMTTSSRIRRVAALLLFVGLAAPAQARTNHALLVAVTAYPNLPPKTALVGPNHDAVLVRDFLTTRAPVPFDPANVTLLANGLEDAQTPTHAAILAALKEMAGKVVGDDFVYLHFSGHGAQQPAIPGDSESDGLDEIFLPADTGKWVDRSRGVPNALMDNEIGAALDAIRDKGAFVWIVIDACHSGTATRAVEVDDVVERKVEAADLGIPDAAMIETGAQGASRSVGEEEDRGRAFGLDRGPTGGESVAKGGLVAFFAAQTVETTPEMPLPKGTPGAAKYGLFTYTLMSKLAENPNMTYRQLGYSVLQQYAADSRPRPTPLFEGELDARVFGTQKTQAVNQWPLDVADGAAIVPAGRLHRLAPGTKLAVMPSPASDLAEALGYVEVRTAGNLESRVVPVAFDNKPALKLADIPATAYARMGEMVLDFTLTVARPAPAPGLEAEAALVNSVVDELAAAPGSSFRIRLVSPGEEADLRFAVARESAFPGAPQDAPRTPALFFLPPSGEIPAGSANRPPRVAVEPGGRDRLAEAIAANLTTIFRATGLSRLASASDYHPEDVSVQFQIRRENQDALLPLEAATSPLLHPGDEVHVSASNKSTRPVDLNILYVGSDYAIEPIAAERLVPGAVLETGLFRVTDASFGSERMIAVLTEAPPQSEVEDLSFLKQGGVPLATREAGEAGGFASLLTAIGLAPATRSVLKLGKKKNGAAKGAVMIYPMQTAPRS